uniref:Phosphopentomutase n=1 Tax=uncultured candidate division Zixibacteria bacterium Rifle_16ft_4_minimus_38126 TaxID=1665171 RepID=A0A0H4TAW2_UNCZI|nr:phosphopentomutase, phosphopentomutase [uncultured candidate division Zixibacteria bacterium Rifle_16ft_4_minimus_38126]
MVLDSCGIGELPDADQYGDLGSNTLVNTARAVGRLHLPNLERLGLGKIDLILGVSNSIETSGNYGKMAELSIGKDSTAGHWEMTGLVLKKPFPVYPQGFPKVLIEKFEQAIGKKTLGNYPASGTEIIARLGEEHLRTGNPIVYTSADSVFQIAAHQEVLPLKELYQICQTAREMLVGEHAVARVIARPFTGKPGNFARTADRRDFSIQPLDQTILDQLVTMGIEVIGIGKIEDLFGGRGITKAFHTQSNRDGVNQTLEVMKHLKSGLIFTSLVDFDTLWGHRNDPVGFARGLEEFDAMLPVILDSLTEDDLLILTADHGCDPTTPSTDHSREYVPLLVCGKSLKQGVNLGVRQSLADIGQTVAEIFNLKGTGVGKSFLSQVIDD